MDIQDNMNYIEFDDYLSFFYKEVAKKERRIRLKELEKQKKKN